MQGWHTTFLGMRGLPGPRTLQLKLPEQAFPLRPILMRILLELQKRSRSASPDLYSAYSCDSLARGLPA